MAEGRLFTNKSYLTVSGTAPRSGVWVDRGLGEWRVVSMACVAVGCLVWVTWLVGDVGIQSVHVVFAMEWRLWSVVLMVALRFWVGAAGWPL